MAGGGSKVTKPKGAAASNRRMKPQAYKSFKLSKRLRHPKGKLKGSFRIFANCIRHLGKNWRVFTGIIVIYLLLTVLLVKGLGGGVGLTDFKMLLQETFEGNASELFTGVALFGILLGSAGTSATETGSVYQSMLLVLFSVILIWVLRQTYAAKKVSVRDGFYKGVYPLIPFTLVLLIIGLQLVPLAAASTLYVIVIEGGLSATYTETVLWLLLLFGLALLSLYWISSSLFGLYIVTLPDMTPLRALRSAKELVRFRRWEIMRKVVFLPVALLVLAGAIMLPLIIYITPAAEWVFFVLNMSGLAVTHSYMYGLYRELL
jgi:hypothetical protein